MELKVSGPSSPGMLAIISEYSLNLIWAEANNAVNLDGIDNSGLSPACEGFSTYTKEFGRLARGEKFLLDVHLISSKSSRILYSVPEFGLTFHAQTRDSKTILFLFF